MSIESLWPYLIAAAVLIVAGLSYYAGHLLLRLKRQAKQQQALALEHQQALHQHDKKLFDSIVIIVRAMQEEQCDLSEGCWRLCVLLDSLKLSQDLSLQFPAIFELYDSIKHMPIREERKKLAKRERMKLDLERTKAEARLQSSITTNLQQLLQYSNERIGVLSTELK